MVATVLKSFKRYTTTMGNLKVTHTHTDLSGATVVWKYIRAQGRINLSGHIAVPQVILALQKSDSWKSDLVA